MILRDKGAPRPRQRIEFHRGETAPAYRFRRPCIVLGRLHLVAPTVSVNAHARTAGAAEKIVDRLPRDLSGDVPQRLLDARGGAIELERAAPLGIVVEGDLQGMPDMERVAADEIAAQFLDLRRNGPVTIILAVGLPPSDHAGIGLEPHEHKILAPTRVNGKALDARDFHVSPRP